MDESTPKSGQPAYVYFITTRRGPRMTKIGVANDPQKRLKTLTTASPFPLYLSAAWLAESAAQAYRVEAGLHAAYAETRSNGEWFLHCELMAWAVRSVRRGTLDLARYGTGDYDPMAKAREAAIRQRRLMANLKVENWQKWNQLRSAS